MSYLSSPTSTSEYGVVLVGNNISVANGIISLSQDLSPNANVTFYNANVTGNLYAGGNLVVTSVTPSNGAGITLSNVVSNGYAASFTVINSGVLSLAAGSGITLTGNTGNITISSFGADLISVVGVSANYTALSTDEYIGVNSANAVTITLPTGIAGRVYAVKDEYGPGGGKIFIKPQTGEKVDNANTYVINVPYQSISVVFRAGTWRVI